MKEKEINDFCTAVLDGNSKYTAKTLKKRHANPNACTGLMPILSYTILNRHQGIAMQLISHPMINLNQRSPSEDKTTPMQYAVSWAPELVAEMLKKYADPNLQDAKGNTALHHAARQTYRFSDTMPALKALLADRRTDVLIKNEAGETAYDVASDEAKAELEKHPYVAKFILPNCDRKQNFNQQAKPNMPRPSKPINRKAPRIIMC